MKASELNLNDISNMIGDGYSVSAICGYFGISSSFWYKHLAHGESLIDTPDKSSLDIEDLADIEFYKTVSKGIYLLEYKQMMNIQAAATKNWKAAAYILEKRLPSEWKDTDTEDNNTVEVIIKDARSDTQIVAQKEPKKEPK